MRCGGTVCSSQIFVVSRCDIGNANNYHFVIHFILQVVVVVNCSKFHAILKYFAHEFSDEVETQSIHLSLI